jgi:hypothetical protein
LVPQQFAFASWYTINRTEAVGIYGNFFILLLRKYGSLYFRVVSIGYEEDGCEEFYLLILMMFMKTVRIISKVVNFLFIS